MPWRTGGHSRGKLIAIARGWAGGRGGGQPADDAATGGAAAVLAAIEARRSGALGADAIEIGPQDWEAVRLFYRLHTQWRVHAMSGVRLGINYAVVARTAAMMEIDMTPALFDDIATMERAALAVFAAT